MGIAERVASGKPGLFTRARDSSPWSGGHSANWARFLLSNEGLRVSAAGSRKCGALFR